MKRLWQNQLPAILALLTALYTGYTPALAERDPTIEDVAAAIRKANEVSRASVSDILEYQEFKRSIIAEGKTDVNIIDAFLAKDEFKDITNGKSELQTALVKLNEAIDPTTGEYKPGFSDNDIENALRGQASPSGNSGAVGAAAAAAKGPGQEAGKGGEGEQKEEEKTPDQIREEERAKAQQELRDRQVQEQIAQERLRQQQQAQGGGASGGGGSGGGGSGGGGQGGGQGGGAGQGGFGGGQGGSNDNKFGDNRRSERFDQLLNRLANGQKKPEQTVSNLADAQRALSNNGNNGRKNDEKKDPLGLTGSSSSSSKDDSKTASKPPTPKKNPAGELPQVQTEPNVQNPEDLLQGGMGGDRIMLAGEGKPGQPIQNRPSGDVLAASLNAGGGGGGGGGAFNAPIKGGLPSGGGGGGDFNFDNVQGMSGPDDSNRPVGGGPRSVALALTGGEGGGGGGGDFEGDGNPYTPSQTDAMAAAKKRALDAERGIPQDIYLRPRYEQNQNFGVFTAFAGATPGKSRVQNACTLLGNKIAVCPKRLPSATANPKDLPG